VLHLHFSNRHEVLAARLADALARSGAGVFEPERVLVPSAAWQRWLALHLAHRLGICSQVDFGFLAPWLWRELPAGDPLRTPAPDTESLAWRAWAWLGDSTTLQRHPVLRGWLMGQSGAGQEARARLELGRRAVALLEQIETWRPHWRAAWAAGRSALAAGAGAVLLEHESWQADLWRHLRGADADLAPAEAPDRPATPGASVHLFAPASMPPLHLAALRRLAQRFEIHAYLFNPCREYWFDLVSPRRFSHLALTGRNTGHEVGHALLTRWGGAVQAQLAQWQEAAGEDAVLDDGDYHVHAESDAAVAPTLLARVQDSLLTLEQPGPGAWAVAADDRSLELHLCHSRQRELEVLLDRLLALLADDPTLGPGDIWVGVTDLDATAPLIEAVFGGAVGRRALPHTITGRGASQGDEAVRGLLALLDIAASRCTATGLFGVLQQPAVAAALGLDAASLADAVAALAQAGLRWGLDDAHLAEHGSPPHGHTLADAIGRLALGACLPADTLGLRAQALAESAASAAGAQGATMAPTLPWPAAVPAGQAGLQLVGTLEHWANGLRRLAHALTRPRPARAWQRLLEAVLDEHLRPAHGVAELAARQALRQQIGAVALAAQRALGDTALPWSAVREALDAALDSPARGGVAAGGVTFSALAPLRGLPFRVVALIGLDDGLFPLPQRAPEFDLLAALPQPGDRQRRLDDRGLMLEALLACRGTLHLSAVGRSAADNSPRPPSVVLSELLEWLLPALRVAGTSGDPLAAAHRHLVVEHPLQPFDLALYDAAADPRWRSSEPAAHAAWQARLDAGPRAAAMAETASLAAPDDDSADFDDSALPTPRGPDSDAPAFVRGPLPDLPIERLDAADLAAFLHHPARHWLRRRLGLAVWSEDRAVEDDEDLAAPASGGRWGLWRHWLPLLLASDGDAGPGLDAAAAAAWTAHAGLGPSGALGAAWVAAEWRPLVAYATAVRRALADAANANLHGSATKGQRFELDLAGPGRVLRLSWALPDGPEAVFWHAGKRSGPRVIQAWLHHLLVLAAAGPGRWEEAAVCTRLLTAPLAPESAATPAETLAWRSGTRAAAVATLCTLVDVYLSGQREPVALLPRSGWAWVESAGNPVRARAAWLGRGDAAPGATPGFGESQDPNWRLVLRGRPDPVATLAFVPWAEAVFGPALAALQRDAAPGEAQAADAPHADAGSAR
jgi:exodeoxyribonuclease V gamma subunit